MVALFGFLHFGEIFFKLRFLFERRTVNAGEHLVLFVPAPVSARHAGQLERLDLARGRQMRPAAEIDEIALLVKGNFRVLGQIVDKFLFIRFAEIIHHFKGVLAAQRKALDGQIALDDLVHFRFDLAEIVLADGRFEIYVVIKTVFDDGPDGELAGRVNGFDRLRQHVRRGMAEHVQPRFVFQRYDFQRAVLVEHVRQID